MELEWEREFLDWLQTLHTPALDAVMVFITRLGNGGVIWIVLAAVLLLIPKTRWNGMLLAAAMLANVVLCNLILKNLVRRPRPYADNPAVQLLVAELRDYSFPSGHTAIAFAVVTALFLAGRKKMWIPSLVLALLIAFSRMYLYVHFPTDILGGMVTGICAGAIGYLALSRIVVFYEKDS